MKREEHRMIKNESDNYNSKTKRHTKFKNIQVAKLNELEKRKKIKIAYNN